MLIGVDGGCLGIKDKRLQVGVYEVAKNLLQSLSKIDKKNNYLLYSFYPIEKSLLKSFGSRMKNVVVSPTRGWMKIWLPMKIRKDKPDVFLALSQTVPSYMPLRKKPYTITFFYDLAFERFPQMYPGSLGKLKRESRNSAQVSNTILSISDNTKKDLVKFYKTSTKRIIVSYPGASNKFRNVGKKYKSDNPYFLFVGSLKKTKNVPGIIKAFHYFLEKTGLNFNLYIVGGDRWFDNEIKQVSKNTLGSSIKFLGFVKEDKLASLYRGATAFVSPSFYEGFGLPMLEAMKSGCPVISSKTGSVPEVVGNAGILVNPKDYKKIGEAMIAVAKNSKKRTALVNKGLKRSDDFIWSRFAVDVLDLVSKKK